MFSTQKLFCLSLY